MLPAQLAVLQSLSLTHRRPGLQRPHEPPQSVSVSSPFFWPSVQFDDVQNVRASDLGALVDHVQQVSVEAVAGVAQVIAASPWMTGSAVAAVLVTVLMRQASMLRSESLDD